MGAIEDIKEAKTDQDKSVRVRQVDGKLVCSFEIHEDDEWFSYEKIFDSISSFNEYIEAFFK